MKLFDALHRWDAVDARACNAFFALSMRGGHVKDAMRAARLAEQCGLQQSNAMLNTLRQARRYKAKLDREKG